VRARSHHRVVMAEQSTTSERVIAQHSDVRDRSRNAPENQLCAEVLQMSAKRSERVAMALTCACVRG